MSLDEADLMVGTQRVYADTGEYTREYLSRLIAAVIVDAIHAERSEHGITDTLADGDVDDARTVIRECVAALFLHMAGRKCEEEDVLAILQTSADGADQWGDC